MCDGRLILYEDGGLSGHRRWCRSWGRNCGQDGLGELRGGIGFATRFCFLLLLSLIPYPLLLLFVLSESQCFGRFLIECTTDDGPQRTHKTCIPSRLYFCIPIPVFKIRVLN